MSDSPIAESPVLATVPLGFPWKTTDPFLFCVYHNDKFPKSNGAMGPAASLAGRQIGSDFAGINGWNMYHGTDVPGFPAHPHRGFETITIVRKGLIDHSDSLGAAARFGGGDVQWMTAGRGVVHSEMMPLMHTDAENPVELFQIWLNLPRASKMVEPHFAMFWGNTLPRITTRTPEGAATDVTVIAGSFGGENAPAPPPDSWASQPGSDVAIWTVRMDAGGRVELPLAAEGTRRVLYFFAGQQLRVADYLVQPGRAVHVDPAEPVTVVNTGAGEAELLVLQGRPIGEPVAAQGPFVMNTPGEIREAMLDYQRTRFGGWPWRTLEPVHPAERGRFARYPDGREVEPAP